MSACHRVGIQCVHSPVWASCFPNGMAGETFSGAARALPLFFREDTAAGMVVGCLYGAKYCWYCWRGWEWRRGRYVQIQELQMEKVETFDGSFERKAWVT